MYVVDYRTSCVKVFSSMRHTSEVFPAIGNLMRAFAIHEKKELYESKSLEEAIVMVTKCLEKIQTYISNVRQYHKKNLKVLTGAECSISSKSLTFLETYFMGTKEIR